MKNNKSYKADMVDHIDRMLAGKGWYTCYLVKFKGKFLTTMRICKSDCHNDKDMLISKLFDYITMDLNHYDYDVYSTFKYSKCSASMELIENLINDGIITIEIHE